MRTQMSIGAFAILIAFAPPIIETAVSAERALTLDEAIALALEKNEEILIQRESVAAAEGAVRGANGAYDPLLLVEGAWQRGNPPVNSALSGAPQGELSPTDESAGGGATIRQLLPTGGDVSLRASASRGETNGVFDLLSPAYGTAVGVELRQPLLRGRVVDDARFTIRVAKADRARSIAELRSEITETVAAVERAYWTLVAARREVEVREEAVRLAEEQLAETRVRVESGAVPETEIAQPRAEVERRRGELLAAQEAASRADTALKLVILGDGDADLWTAQLSPVEDAEMERIVVDVGKAMERALTSRPELEAATAAVERRRAETAFARNGIRPTLDAVVSYDRYGLAGSENPAAMPGNVPAGLEGDWGESLGGIGAGDFDDTRVALVFAFPIGNRAARGATTVARSVERQAEAGLARARKAVRADVLDAAATLETAGQRIEAARAGREAAEVQLAAERDRYNAGLSTNFLVLTRQNDLSRARLDEISALTDYRTARTEMARATGSLLEERGIDPDETAP